MNHVRDPASVGTKMRVKNLKSHRTLLNLIMRQCHVMSFVWGHALIHRRQGVLCAKIYGKTLRVSRDARSECKGI